MKDLITLFAKNSLKTAVLVFAILCLLVPSSSGKADPDYQAFCYQAHVVCVSTDIAADETWITDNVYVIYGSIKVNEGVTLTIQPKTIVKFYGYTYLDVFGTLLLNGSKNNEVIFTSIRDDIYGGDTNQDANNTNPAPGDWRALFLENSLTDFHDVILRYSSTGLTVWNETTSDINPPISHNTFEQNIVGVMLIANSSKDITSPISNNVFTGNFYGFGTDQYSLAVTGISRPTLKSNDFNNNTVLPIYLGSTSFPIYDTNSFQGFPTTAQRLGIGLGGHWTRSGTWPSIPGVGANILPYVVLNNVVVNTGVTISIPAGTVIKFDIKVSPDPSLYMDVFGTLDMQSTAGSEIVFTSFRDDTVGGDTNGDGSDLEPLPGDWRTIYLENDLTVFDFTKIRYANTGVTIYNEAALNLAPRIENNTFQKNNYGIHYQACQTGQNAGTLLNNSFLDSETFPILMNGSAYPVFTNNTFAGNKHPALGLTGSWYGSGTWPSIVGDNSQVLPYVVVKSLKCDSVTKMDGVKINQDANITIPAGTVFKFDTGTWLDSLGVLQMNSTPAASDKIIFTSYKDDTYKGNTDGLSVLPARGDWDSVYIETVTGSIHDFVTKYSTHGISVYNTTNSTLSPSITNGLLQENINGVYLYTEKDGDITSTISNNTFTNNTYGLGTYTNPPVPPLVKPTFTGAARPSLINNSFVFSSGFPIFLNGTGYPHYISNSFANNTHRAIGLGGYFNASGTLELVPGDGNAPFSGKAFPYVVQNSMPVKDTATITILGGTVIKFEKDKYMDVFGTLDIQSSPAAQIYYTSYKDDFYDDTNADAGGSTPSRGDWTAIYLESSGTNFNYSNVKYSSNGVTVYNQTYLNIAPNITNSRFEENVFAIYLDTEAYGDIKSNIVNNTFISNSYGLGTYVGVFPNGGHAYGCARPNLTSNSITKSSEFPLYYNGCADPVYIANTFAQNTHPAIALGGFWTQNVTWQKLAGDQGLVFPYVVVRNVYEDYGPVLTIPDSLIVKFDTGTYLYVDGLLNMQSTPDHQIVFTSYKDDSYAGDTNADGGASTPAPSDWKTIWISDYPNKTNDLHDMVAKYATAAIGIYYDGPANTSISTIVRGAQFVKNHVGLVLAIGWANYDPYYITGEGNIISPISDTTFQDNNYGLVTFADPYATGTSNPRLQNVTISNSVVFPIFLGGTAFPQFVGGNNITNTLDYTSAPESPSLLDLNGKAFDLELPTTLAETSARVQNENAQVAQSPLLFQTDQQQKEGISIANAQTSAIALGGYFNNSGTLPAIGLPFVLPGNYPLIISYYNRSSAAAPSLTIGIVNPANSNVTFPVGSVVKFGLGLYMDVMGKADLQGTLTNPVIFTSLLDDSVSGDTNKDGSSTYPNKGDWSTIYLESSATNFSNSVVKYSTDGLQLYFNGAVNMNINPLVSSSMFLYNKTALTMWALGAGDIMSEIHNNLFMNNDVTILGHLNVDSNNHPSTGRLLVDIHDNDLLGTTDYGVNNLSTNYTLKALNNYWGDPSGPQHNTNPNGKGTRVSNRVNFSPWGAAGTWTRTYSIKGRIVTSDSIPVGIEGANLILSNGLSTQTNPGGYFSFDNLQPGNYSVTPVLNGYTFAPGSYTVNTPPDATDRVIVGFLTTQPTYTISGKVTENRGFAVQGVVVTLDNGSSTLTDKNGFYIFSGLFAKSYRITAILQGFTFTPVYKDVTIGPNALNQDFKLNANYGVAYPVFLPGVRR